MTIPRGIMATIAAEVAEKHRITLDDLRPRSQKRRHAWPRQEAIALMMAAGKSSTQAGRFFCRDHSTALYAKRRYAERQGRAK